MKFERNVQSLMTDFVPKSKEKKRTETKMVKFELCQAIIRSFRKYFIFHIHSYSWTSGVTKVALERLSDLFAC